MNTTTELRPVAEGERLHALDVLRGFALFGILLVNIEGIVGPFSASISGTNPDLAGADYWADAAVYILAQGKFYTIFSLLFGIGFAVILERARSAGRPFKRLYLRRLSALAAFGLVHAYFIRSGDILLIYAVFGLFLMFFINTPQSRLPKYGLALYLVPVALVLFGGAIGSLAQMNEFTAAEFRKSLQQEASFFSDSIKAQRQAYGSGTYGDTVRQAAADMGIMWNYMIFAGWQILGLFLLGQWFYRSGAIVNPQAWPRLYGGLRYLALPVGFAMMLASFWMLPSYDFTTMDMSFGMANALNFTGCLLMSLGYVSWIMRGLSSPAWGKRLLLLAPAGRMALTNYLLQSIICVLIFYNYGLGFYEQLPRVWQIPFTLVLFGLQVVFSHWWLAHFRFGPAEWLWRSITYLKLPRMKKQPPPLPMPPLMPNEL